METDSNKPQLDELDEVAGILRGIAFSIQDFPLSDHLLALIVEETDKALALLQRILDERSRAA